MTTLTLAQIDDEARRCADPGWGLPGREVVRALIEYAKERAARELAEALLPDPDHWMLELVHSGHMAGDVNPHTGKTLTIPALRYYAVAQSAWLTEPSDWAGPEGELRGSGATPTAAYIALAEALKGRAL